MFRITIVFLNWTYLHILIRKIKVTGILYFHLFLKVLRLSFALSFAQSEILKVYECKL